MENQLTLQEICDILNLYEKTYRQNSEGIFMAEFNDFNSQSNDVVTGVEHAKKGKGGLVAGITAGVLVVAVGGGFAAYASSSALYPYSFRPL